MATRKAYLLTTRVESERTQFSKGVLESVGFTVIPFLAIPSTSPVLSNKESLYCIYETIAQGDDEWAYVFEDDINLLEPIDLNEILQYENISQYFFYLGVCKYHRNRGITSSNVFIQGKNVFVASGKVRGTHAFGLSKTGAAELVELFKILSRTIDPADMILEEYSRLRPANVVRYDLESYIPGHRGVFFQDRRRFPSQIPLNLQTKVYPNVS